MKFTLIVATVTCVLSIGFAAHSEKVEQANAEVAEYIREHMISLPRMRTAVDHFACYDDLTRETNRITEVANEKSEACIRDADINKASTLEQLKTVRFEMSAQVSQIHNSFFNCARVSAGLEYFRCLTSAVDGDADIMSDIRERSQRMIDQYANTLEQIAVNERSCLATVIDEAKEKSDEGFQVLRQCLAQN